LKGSEKDVLIDMLDEFIDHIKESKNKSLIARIYGLYTVKTENLEPIDLIVMQNTSRLKSARMKDI